MTFRSALVPPYVRRTKTLEAALPCQPRHLTFASAGQNDQSDGIGDIQTNKEFATTDAVGIAEPVNRFP